MTRFGFTCNNAQMHNTAIPTWKVSEPQMIVEIKCFIQKKSGFYLVHQINTCQKNVSLCYMHHVVIEQTLGCGVCESLLHTVRRFFIISVCTTFISNTNIYSARHEVSLRPRKKKSSQSKDMSVQSSDVVDICRGFQTFLCQIQQSIKILGLSND